MKAAKEEKLNKEQGNKIEIKNLKQNDRSKPNHIKVYTVIAPKRCPHPKSHKQSIYFITCQNEQCRQD